MFPDYRIARYPSTACHEIVFPIFTRTSPVINLGNDKDSPRSARQDSCSLPHYLAFDKYALDNHHHKEHNFMHNMEVIEMRATLSIPDELIENLVRETGAKNKTQAIIRAIEEYLKKTRLEKLLFLQGKLDLEDNWQEMEACEMKELQETWDQEK
jgi:hypothetical protein